ncbi:MAG: cation:dicarboxylase symporter family transporter, partial [Pseudomonadota bacterium]
MSLANKVLIALLLGIGVGYVLNATGIAEHAWVDANIINGLFYVIGKLFVNALKMLVVPLVLFSLIPGIIGIGDIRLLGKIGSKTFLLYLATTAIAISTAIAFAVLFGIGENTTIDLASTFEGKQAGKSFADILVGVVPPNIFAAMANGEMLAIIFFSIFFGIALLIEVKKSAELITLIEQINHVIMRMIELVMLFAPIAVFCLVGKAVAELGLDLVSQLLGYFLVVIAALLFHAFVTQMA